MKPTDIDSDFDPARFTVVHPGTPDMLLPQRKVQTQTSREREARMAGRSAEFYMYSVAGSRELDKRLRGHWPAIKIVREALRQANMGNTKPFSVSSQRLKDLGISPQQRREAVVRMQKYPDWFKVAVHPTRAPTLELTAVATSALQHHGGRFKRISAGDGGAHDAD